MSMMTSLSLDGSGGGSSDPIFSLGGALERLGNTALDAFDKVAPVWLANELDMDKRQPIAVAPTFKADPQNQPTQNLTSSPEGQQDTGFVIRQETLVLVGGGLAVLGAIVFLND